MIRSNKKQSCLCVNSGRYQLSKTYSLDQTVWWVCILAMVSTVELCVDRVRNGRSYLKRLGPPIPIHQCSMLTSVTTALQDFTTSTLVTAKQRDGPTNNNRAKNITKIHA